MVSKRGMGSNPFAAKTAKGAEPGDPDADAGPSGRPRRAARSSGMVGALRSGSVDAGVQRIRVDQTAPNPDNPAERSESLDLDLLASIQQIGVLVPLVVMSRERFVVGHPEHAEAVSAAEWVVLAGHRRRRHALEAGVEEVDAIVRDDLDERVDEVVIAENVHRADLRPIQEALAYHRVLERRGLSQRKAAEHLGVPQGQISKRLRLLQLPESLWPLVDQGELEIQRATELLNELDAVDENLRERVRDLLTRVCEAATSDPEVREQWKGSWSWQLPQALRAAVQQARDEVAQNAAREQAEAEGLKVVLDPGSTWGVNAWDRELTTKKDIDAARKKGTLVVGANRNGAPKYYTDAKRDTKVKKLSPHEQEQREQQRLRKQAMTARRDFLTDRLADRGFLRAARPLITLCVVGSVNLGDTAAQVAIKVRGNSGIGPEPTKGETWGWRRALARERNRDAVAVLLAIGGLEDRASWTHGSWGERSVVEYLDWLMGQGYEPTPWEVKRLEAGRERLSAEDGGEDAPVGDSTESPVSYSVEQVRVDNAVDDSDEQTDGREG